MAEKEVREDQDRGSSPASRGGAGTYIEGELGALYLLAMLADIPAHGLPGARITYVRFQGTDLGFKLDDLIIQGIGSSGDVMLEIQSKRDITFSPGDAVFKDVAAQIARSKPIGVAEDRHYLGIATQRTSRKISGAYQDVLRWAATADNAAQFFARLDAKGVGNDDMRTFVATTRANLRAAGAATDEEATWRVLRRLLILEFDFESSAPLARTYGHMLARQVLADEDAGRGDGLWRALIEIAIATGTAGGALDRDRLKLTLADAGFKLAGDRDYQPARVKLAEMAQMSLDSIGITVAGVTLPRIGAVEALDDALEAHRFVEIRAAPGVGKSGILRHCAERLARQSPVVVLDRDRTPAGGWTAMASLLGIPGTASAFLTDLAASGGATIFVDGLDMFDDSGRQRTVEDLLRAAVRTPGFRVVATVRAPVDADVTPWLPDDIVESYGGVHRLAIDALDDNEVAFLVKHAPELRALLDPGHPAAAIARNLYRLSRLLKVPKATEIRTEAQLADRWWKSADEAPVAAVRTAQRLLENLADRSLRGEGAITLQTDSVGRSHMIGTLTLAEVRRDHLDFYHDVLRDWAIGCYIAEDPTRLNGYDLSKPIAARVARGIEFAGRLALEKSDGCARWVDLLGHLTPEQAHGSWRRQAMLALTRSEARRELLEKATADLLANGAALFEELCTTINAVETQATVDVLQMPGGVTVDLPRSYRTNTTGSAFLLLRWVLDHEADIPLEAIGGVTLLVEIQLHFLKLFLGFARPTAELLFGWLRQLDVRDTAVTIPGGRANSRSASDMRRRTIEKLRMMSLLLGEFAPGQLKAYLNEIAGERADHKVKDIRTFSQAIAPVAPAELADLILANLIEKRDRRRRSPTSRDRALSHDDSSYLPPSPAQPPFLDLLEAAPAEGLRLVRTLVTEVVDYYSGGREPGSDGYTLDLETGPRFFPWINSVFWSRDQSHDYSVASGLKALEAWSHKRLDEGEPVDAVLADILGPEGSCAAYLQVAIDVLLSHFEKARDALAPFIANPYILGLDQSRRSHDTLGSGIERFGIGDEPSGKVKLADLRGRKSRTVALLDAIPSYLGDDPVAERLRAVLAAEIDRLEPFEPHSNWTDPRFIGRFAQHMLQRANWIAGDDGNYHYQTSSELRAHQEQMGGKHAQAITTIETESRITVAIEGGEHASVETARLAIGYAAGALPDDSDTDSLKSRSTRLIATALLVTRDGDDSLLAEHEDWVRQVIAIGLGEEADRYRSGKLLRFHRPAMAALALIHLWARQGNASDRDALIALAVRRDRAAVLAFDKASTRIIDVDPRMLKAAMRAAYSSMVWRWHEHDEDEVLQRAFEVDRDAAIATAVAAEIVWLEGGAEPTWPAWPHEQPTIRQSSRLRVPGRVTREEFDAGLADGDLPSRPTSMLHVDSSAAAQWLTIIREAPAGTMSWSRDVMTAYADWTGRISGLGLAADVETDREPAEWNAEFYILFAEHLLDAAEPVFESDVHRVTDLPDRSFSDIAPVVLQAADALYFNDPARLPARPVALRTHLAARIMALSRWRHVSDPGRSSIDLESGSVVAKVLLNNHNPFSRTQSYLPPLLFDRVDPLLDTLRPLLPGGPTSFVALCTMNLLLVAPRARHLAFLLAAVEAWFDQSHEASLWLEAGIGAQVIKWLEAAVGEDPGLLAPEHRARHRIDRMLGRLVSVGVAEAHEWEQRIEAVARA